jgi:hypothetical protein
MQRGYYDDEKKGGIMGMKGDERGEGIVMQIIRGDEVKRG